MDGEAYNPDQDAEFFPGRLGDVDLVYRMNDAGDNC